MPPLPRDNRDNRDPLECSKIVVFAERVVTFGSGRRSRVMFFSSFVGQHRTNRLLLRPVSDHGGPTIVSKVGVSREASQKKSKNVARENLSGVLARCFSDFFSDSLVRNTYF